MKCPACGRTNPKDAARCVCGHPLGGHRAVSPVVFPADQLPGAVWFFIQSWRTFGANWRTFLVLAAVPTVVLPLAWALTFSSTAAKPPTAFPWIAAATFTLITLIIMVVNTGAFMAAAHRTSEGDAVTLGESYALSLRQIGPFVWTGLLYGVIVVAGLVLFVVPGIVLAIRYFAAPYLVIIEGTSGRAALSRSTALAQGRKLPIWWRELGCTILFSLTLYLAGLLVRIAVGAALGDPGAAFAEPKPLWSETVELYANIVSQALFVIFNVLLVKSLRTLALPTSV